MPYIKKEDRKRLDTMIGDLADSIYGDVGKMNYVITSLLLGQHSSCYSDYNAIIGVLESTKLEFYRRAVASYEEAKRIENGDVY